MNNIVVIFTLIHLLQLASGQTASTTDTSSTNTVSASTSSSSSSSLSSSTNNPVPTSTTNGGSSLDFCAGKLDGSYCLNNIAYTCGFGRITGVQSCTFCVQTSTYVASCSSYQVPSNFCTSRISGFYCYRPIGSSIETSIQCDYQKIFQRTTCPGYCDTNTGFCVATTAVGATAAPCPNSCKYGCTFTGQCALPPYCYNNKVLDLSDTRYCGTSIKDRRIADQINVYAQDNDARTQVQLLSTWNNVTYSTECVSIMKQFTCESKFLNCDEKKSGFSTCKTVCQETIKCMENDLQTMVTGVIAPINCKLECSSGHRLILVNVSFALIMLLSLLL